MRIIVVQSATLKLKTKGLKLSSMNQTLKYYTLIETCKNVGLNVKEYFAYVSVNLYRARGITKDFLPVLSHGKFK